MPWGVAAAAVGAAGSMYASNQAGKQQDAAQKQNIAYQNQAAQGFTPYTSTGANANDALNTFMGLGNNNSEEDLMNQYRDQFAKYKKKSSGGGLGKAIGGLTGLGTDLAGKMLDPLNVAKLKGNKNYKLIGYDEAGLKNKVQTKSNSRKCWLWRWNEEF
jgi:hypothetical protein